jgi:hypothetical protein
VPITFQQRTLGDAPVLIAFSDEHRGADPARVAIAGISMGGYVVYRAVVVEPRTRAAVAKLQQIIRKVNIPVPMDFAIKDTSRMVSNCLDAITFAVELHKKARTLVLDSQQVQDIDTSHVPAIVGNWVSHYETGSGSSLSAPALGGIVNSIDALAECFKYDDVSGGSSVRKWYRSLSNR